MSNEIGVIFDMDGLLLDTEQVYLDCYLDTQVELGFEKNATAFLNNIGTAGDTQEKALRSGFDPSITYAQINEIWDAKIAERLREVVPVKKGVVELLNILRDRNIPMGVATSSLTKTAHHHLKLAGIFDFFTYIVGRDQVQNPKPNPEPYLLAASKIDRDIKNCFAFEDSETGTIAAIASGAKVTQVPDLQQPSAALVAKGHFIAPDLMTGARGIGLV